MRSRPRFKATVAIGIEKQIYERLQQLVSANSGLIGVAPMRDEIAIAHEARRRIVVGARHLHEHLAWLRANLSGVQELTDAAPHLDLLARSSGLSTVAYARDHSLMATFITAAPIDQCHTYGSEEMTERRKQLGMRVPKKWAVVCHACIEQDLATVRFSWFHRSHQIAGLDWCPEHRIALHQVMSDQPFEQLPHNWRDAALISESPMSPHQWPENEFIRRYVDLSVAILQRERPVFCNTLNQLISEQAKAINVGKHKSKIKSFLSDLILDLAGEDWLFKSFPNYSVKTKRLSLSAMDCILMQRQSAPSGSNYILALAAIFDTTESALKAISLASVDRRAH